MAARARFALYKGDYDHATKVLHDLLPEGPETTPDDNLHFLPGHAHRTAVELAIESGNLARARDWIEAHDRWLDWSGAVSGRAEGSLLWARIRLAEGNTDTAAERAAQALDQASHPRQLMALIAVHRFMGERATQAGELDVAESHIEQSLKLVEACDLPYERALTLLASAELEIAKDNRGVAVDLLDEVRRVGTELGARPMLDRAETMAAGLTTPRKTDARYGLSARELEVLELLVEGRSNKEIGDELYISPRTVMQHVSSILRKLNVENRSAVTARAIRENLI